MVKVLESQAEESGQQMSFANIVQQDDNIKVVSQEDS